MIFTAIIHCPSLVAPNTSISNNETQYEAKTIVTCHSGFEFPDESTTINVACRGTKQWEPPPPKCQRKLSVTLQTIVFSYKYSFFLIAINNNC